jgi:hypothetical protein
MWVRGRGLFFQFVFELWCGEWTVHCSLSTWTVDSWLSIFLGLAGGVVKPKSSQVSDLFPKEFPIAPYFYPICFGKCCPPFIYIDGVSYCLWPMFPLGAYDRICGRAPCGFTELHCPMCEALYSRSVVSLCVVSFLEGEYPRKSHTVGILLSSMVFLSPMRNERCTPASIAPNSQCFEGLLLVFHFDYSGVCILTADDHPWYATSSQATLFSRASTKPHLVILC